MDDTLYRIKCPDCRLELHWDDEAFRKWKQGPTKCPQCGAALGDMVADEVPLGSEPRRPQTDTEWLDFLEVLGRTPPDGDGDWCVRFSKSHRNLRAALALAWENSPRARGAYHARHPTAGDLSVLPVPSEPVG
jgi:hypothetical protein